jgi:hypothetical protein
MQGPATPATCSVGRLPPLVGRKVPGTALTTRLSAVRLAPIQAKSDATRRVAREVVADRWLLLHDAKPRRASRTDASSLAARTNPR